MDRRIALFAAALALGCGASPPPGVAGTAPVTFAYTHPVRAYLVDEALAPNGPSNPVAGLGSFQVSGLNPLPAGLALDPVSGAISGTPTATQQPTAIAITAVAGGTTYTATVHLAVYQPPAPSYVVRDGTVVPGSTLLARTAEFYDETRNWPVWQSEFGFCETASHSGLLSYAYHGNTNQVSPLLTLFHAFDDPGSGFNVDVSKHPTWSTSFYLWHTPALGPLWDFYEDQGYVAFTGEPDATSTVFDTLYRQVEQLGQAPPEGVAGTAEWATRYAAYEAALLSQAGSFTITKRDVRSDFVGMGALTPGATSKSEAMAAALDKGYLVEIMIKVHGFPGNGIYYSYGAPTLAPGSPPASGANNVWSLGRPPTLGGDHWVYVFSYATASDGSGRKIFFVRNSWGSANGENGNYYMTDDFVNGIYWVPPSGGTAGHVEDIVQNTWAIPVQKERPPPP